MKRFVGLAVFGCALLGTVPVRAEDHDDNRENVRVQRYYDRHGRDWHNWDANETRYYRRYVVETHHDDREFARLKRRQQDEYFRWRHEHAEENR